MNIYAISNSQGQAYSTLDVNKKLEDAGIPDEVIQKGDDAVQAYAYEHHITLPTSDEQQKTEQPKTVGLKKGGDHKAEMEAKLEALGIPKETIAQGKEAVQQYAAANNIELPAPPARGAHLNLVA